MVLIVKKEKRVMKKLIKVQVVGVRDSKGSRKRRGKTKDLRSRGMRRDDPLVKKVLGREPVKVIMKRWDSSM